MKVICRKITSRDFDLKKINTVFTNDFDYSYGGHGLQLNAEYFVMGILAYQNSSCLYYLVDIEGKPDWFPSLLFDISNNLLPREWFIKINIDKNESDIYWIFGFDELCNQTDFYDKVLDREEDALRSYFRWKIKFEKELSE